MFMRFVLLFERTRLVANTFFERHLDLLQHVPKGSRWPIPSPLCEARSQCPVKCWAANSSATDRNWLLSLTTRSFITYKKGPFPATNVSVKSKLQHPPGQSPGHLTFWKLLFKSPPPPTRAKMPFKCPTLVSIKVIKCPHPGDISRAPDRHINDRRTTERKAFSCRTKSL